MSQGAAAATSGPGGGGPGVRCRSGAGAPARQRTFRDPGPRRQVGGPRRRASKQAGAQSSSADPRTGAGDQSHRPPQPQRGQGPCRAGRCWGPGWRGQEAPAQSRGPSRGPSAGRAAASPQGRGQPAALAATSGQQLLAARAGTSPHVCPQAPRPRPSTRGSEFRLAALTSAARLSRCVFL